jgi:hypothetical protein
MAKYVPSPRGWVREQVDLTNVAVVRKAPLCVIQGCQ